MNIKKGNVLLSSPFLCFLFLIISGVIVYSNSFSGEFIFDDIFILNSPQIHHLWPLSNIFAGDNRPLLRITIALNYALGTNHVWGYHAFNLFIHICAALTLFSIVRLTLHCDRLRQQYAHRSQGLALCVALIWLIHPLQTQSVTYIIQRAESMMGLFYLLALFCAARCIGKQNRKGWMTLSIVCCAVGLTSKEVIVTAPMIILIYDRIFWGKSFREIFQKRKGLYLGLFGTWLIPLYLLSATSYYAESAGFAFKGFTPIEYAVTQPGVILNYLKLSFLPTNLVLDYLWPPARTPQAIFPPMTVIVVLLGLTGCLLRKKPEAGFLGAWFFIILSITSSIIPIADMTFEHRMYLPLAAVIAAAVFGGEALLQKVIKEGQQRKIVAIVLMMIISSALGTLTYVRNFDYHNEEIMLRDTIKKRPQNVRAHVDLGLKLVMRKKFDEGVYHLKRALELKPDSEKAYHHLGLASYHQKQWQEAFQYFSKAVELKPDYDEAIGNLGLTYAAIGNFEQARKQYALAIAKNESYAEGHNNMCSLLLSHGFYNEAIPFCEKAIKIKPHYATPYNNLGAIYIHLSKLNQAKYHLHLALKLNPNYAKALNNLGVVYKIQGRYPEALKLFKQAIAIEPDYGDALRNIEEVNVGWSASGR